MSDRGKNHHAKAVVHPIRTDSAEQKFLDQTKIPLPLNIAVNTTPDPKLYWASYQYRTTSYTVPDGF
jgi:hypothetical protein